MDGTTDGRTDKPYFIRLAGVRYKSDYLALQNTQIIVKQNNMSFSIKQFSNHLIIQLHFL